MNRISTSQVYASALLGVMQAQQRQADAARQVATGVRADDLKGYADQGATLQASRTVSARTQALLDDNAVLTERLNAQADALTNLSAASQGAAKALGEVIATGDASTLVQTLQGWFGQASQALNADYAGQYLFAGGTTDQPPVDTTDIHALTGAAPASQHFHDGDLVRSDRIDETTTVQTSLKAVDIGRPLFEALKTVMDYDQPPTGPLTGKLTPAQMQFLQAQLPVINAATDTVRGAQTRTGVLQAQVETATSVLTGRKSAVDGLIGARTEVDPAEAASRLQLAGVTLQASAQVFASLSGSSLLDALRG